MVKGCNHIKIEIVYALPDTQILEQITIRSGDTAEQAILESGILERFPEITLTNNRIGIFGNFVKPNTILRPNDRLEIYRPLTVDPKKARLLRAQKAKNKSNCSSQ